MCRGVQMCAGMRPQVQLSNVDTVGSGTECRLDGDGRIAGIYRHTRIDWMTQIKKRHTGLLDEILLATCGAISRACRYLATLRSGAAPAMFCHQYTLSKNS